MSSTLCDQSKTSILPGRANIHISPQTIQVTSVTTDANPKFVSPPSESLLECGSEQEVSLTISINSFPSTSEQNTDSSVNETIQEEQSSNSPETFMCHICQLHSKSRECYNEHLGSHFDFRCQKCPFRTKIEESHQKHLELVHNVTSEELEKEQGIRVPKVNSQGKLKTFKCKQCQFVSVTKEEFWQHTRTHIKPEKMLTCPKCSFVTEYKHHLDYHLRNHFGDKPYKCSACTYSCVNKSMLNSHMKSHTTIYQYRCANCNYATKYCHSLKLHLRKYRHSPAMVLNPDGTPNPLPIIDVYGTRRGPKSKNHSAGSDGADGTSLSHREKQHKCQQCEFETASVEIFNNHLLLHKDYSYKKSPSCEKKLVPNKQDHEEPQNSAGFIPWGHEQIAIESVLPRLYLENVLSRLRHNASSPNPEKNDESPTEIGQGCSKDREGKRRRKGKATKIQRLEETHDGSLEMQNPSNTCHRCDIKFGNHMMHKIHLICHSKTVQFKCALCLAEFQDGTSFFLHTVIAQHDPSHFLECT